MTWTYDVTLLGSASTSTSSLMKIRLIVGDTDTTRQQLQDEEIYFLLGAQPVITYAAADAADLLAAKYAFQVNTENSKLAVFAAARHKHYVDLAGRLRKAGPGQTPGGDGAGLILGGSYAGNTSAEDVAALESNTDNLLPSFRVGQDDYRGTDYSNPLFGED